MKGIKILYQPLNQVYAPDPCLPPLFTIEFQNTESHSFPFTTFSLSSINLSSKGSKDSHHQPLNSFVVLLNNKLSAFFLMFIQSYAVPSSVIDGNPHLVIILYSKKLLQASITVTLIAMFSAADKLENGGTNSYSSPSTMFLDI